MKESDLYAEVKQALILCGCVATRLQAGRRLGVRMADAGWADIVACGPHGRHVEVEVKREGMEPNAAQWAHGYEVKRRGGLWFVAHNAEDVIAMRGEIGRQA